MKILYYFAEVDTPMFQWQRKHIVDELTRHAVELVAFNPLKYSGPEEANEKVLEEAKNGRYDLFLSSVCYEKMLFSETIKEIKRIGIPTLSIIWDNLMVPYFNKNLASYFDLIWLTAYETSRLYKKWGVNYFVAPYAANPFTYYYNTSRLNRHACFVGNPHGSRAIMINTLTSGQVPVDLYCGGGNINKKEKATLQNVNYDIINPSTHETVLNRFRFKEGWKLLIGSVFNRLKGETGVIDNEFLYKHSGLSHEDMVETYSSSVLSLASTSAGHTDVLRSPLPIINLRNFEIPMCGGIEICKYNKELASYFEEGQEIVFYSSEEELVDKARYYTQKATDKEIYAIKEAARKRAENDHTWWNRFIIAFDILGLKYD